MCVDGWPAGRHVQLSALGKARFPGAANNIWQIETVKHHDLRRFSQVVCLHRVLPTRSGYRDQYNPDFLELIPVVMGVLIQ